MNISSHNSQTLNLITFLFFHLLELNHFFVVPTSIFNAQLLSSQNVPLVPTKTTPSAGGDFDGADGSTVGAFQGQCHGDAWHRHCNLVLRWPDDERILRFGLPENLGKGWWKVGGPNKTEEWVSYMVFFWVQRMKDDETDTLKPYKNFTLPSQSPPPNAAEPFRASGMTFFCHFLNLSTFLLWEELRLIEFIWGLG